MCVWWHWPKADGQNAAVGGVDNGGRWRAALCPMRRWRFPPISTLMVGVKGGIYADGEGGLEMFPTHTDQESAMANDANNYMSGGGGAAVFPIFLVLKLKKYTSLTYMPISPLSPPPPCKISDTRYHHHQGAWNRHAIFGPKPHRGRAHGHDQ